MATGAVLFSLPIAMAFAAFGLFVHQTTLAESVLIYMTVGTTILLSATLFSGLRLDDLR